MLNFILCDDNEKVLNKLSHMFDNIFIKNDFEAKVAFTTTKDSVLLDYIKKNPIDVLVLDINLHSKLSGLEIAKQVRDQNKDCYIIFTTGHSEYVFLAYQCKTFDYICKPITEERLNETVLRLIDDLNKGRSRKKYIRLNNRNTIIDEGEVQYIKREGMKVIFHTKSRDYEVYSSFAKLQEQLPNNFVRCHKSFIANVHNITKLEPTANAIYFDNGFKCDIGPKYKSDFIKGVKLYG